MNQGKAPTIISSDTVVEGEVRAVGGCVEVYGYVEGRLSTGKLIIHQEGKVIGTVDADDADVKGILQGEAHIRGLVDIAPTGSVAGDVRYGRLSLKEGGELSADLKNIPPTLAGDMKLSVTKGKAVRLTTEDLTAIDPDDDAEDLVFAVSDMKNGYVVSLDKPKVAATSFTQADLEKGTIVFVHDGKEDKTASFAVSVTDKAGASSGAPKVVEVDVRH